MHKKGVPEWWTPFYMLVSRLLTAVVYLKKIDEISL